MGKSLKASVLCLGLLFALPVYAQGILPGVLSPVSAKPQSGTPSFSPGAGTYTGTQSVTISATGGSVICYNTTGSPATNGTTGCTAGTLYTGAVSVSTSETLYAVSGGTGYTDSTVSSAAYTISAAGATFVQACTGPQVGGYATNIVATCSNPITAGDLLLYSFSNNTGSVYYLNAGDTGGLVADPHNPVQSALNCFYKLSATGGSTFQSMTLTTGYFYYSQLMVLEFAPPAGHSFTFDTSDVGNTGTSTTMTSLLITPGHSGELIFGYGGFPYPATANSPFTLAQSVASGNNTEYDLQESTGAAIAASFSFSASSTWVAHVMAFSY